MVKTGCPFSARDAANYFSRKAAATCFVAAGAATAFDKGLTVLVGPCAEPGGPKGRALLAGFVSTAAVENRRAPLAELLGRRTLHRRPLKAVGLLGVTTFRLRKPMNAATLSFGLRSSSLPSIHSTHSCQKAWTLTPGNRR